MPMPDVPNVAVVDVPDERFGQTLCAVVFREAGGGVSMNDVLKHCVTNLEPFLVPHDYVFLNERPKSWNGKIDRAGLKILRIAFVHLRGKSATKDVARHMEQSSPDKRSQDVVQHVGQRGIPGREIHLQQFDEQADTGP